MTVVLSKPRDCETGQHAVVTAWKERKCYLDDRWKEVLEAISSKMHVSHETEEPDNGVLSSLLETHHSRAITLVGSGIELHTVVREASLLFGEPLSVVWEIGKNEVSDDCNDEGDNTLENKEPFPAGET